jgi:hypothetical protein
VERKFPYEKFYLADQMSSAAFPADALPDAEFFWLRILTQ